MELSLRLIQNAIEKGAGVPLSYESKLWLRVWYVNRALNFGEHWKAKGKAFMDSLGASCSALKLTLDDADDHLDAGHMKWLEDHMTSLGPHLGPHSLGPTVFCIAQPPPKEKNA